MQKTPRALKSPRAVKKQPTILQTVFEKSLCLTDKDIPWAKRAELYGKRIMGSFSLGQSSTLLRVLYYNRDYTEPSYCLYFASDKPVVNRTVVVRDYMTKQVICNVQNKPIQYEFVDDMTPTLEWLKKQGLSYMLVCEQLGKTSLGNPDLSDWAYLLVYPDMDVLERRAGYLSSLWKSSVVVKCVDDSKHQQWYDRVKVCFQLGVSTPVIICLLYYKSDYFEASTSSRPEFICAHPPVEYLSFKPIQLHTQLVLDTKFAALIHWVQHHKLRWTLGLCEEEQGQDQPISDTAYFMVWPSDPFGLNEQKIKHAMQ